MLRALRYSLIILFEFYFVSVPNPALARVRVRNKCPRKLALIVNNSKVF